MSGILPHGGCMTDPRKKEECERLPRRHALIWRQPQLQPRRQFADLTVEEIKLLLTNLTPKKKD